MRDSKSSGKRPIKEVQELRARKPKLERASSDITERTKTEEKLRQSEQRFRSIFDNANDIIGFVNTTGKIIEVNKKVADILGYEPDELVGKNFMKCGILPIKNAPTIIRLFKELVKRRGLPDIEGDVRNVTQLALRHKKGHTVFVEASTTAIKTDGKLEGFLSVLRDITERKTAEHALKESEEKYRQIVELAPDGIVTVDLKGMITSCNTSLLEGTGYSKDDFVGRHFSKIPTARLRNIPKYIKMFNSLLRGKVPEPFESEWIHKDGTEHWSEAHVGVLKRHGKTMGFQVITRDITNRKRAEKQLRQSKEFLANMIDALDDPVFVKDQQHRWAILNDAACKVMGRSREELIGKSDYDLFSKQQADVFWQRDDSVLKSGRTDINEEEITWHGKLHTISTKKSLFTDSVTGKKFVVGTIRDITDRKKAEEALAESEKKYRELVETSLDMIFALDVHGNFTFTNRAWTEHIGYSCDEANKMNGFDLVHPDDLDELKKRFANVIKGTSERNVEFRSRTKKGNYLSVLINGSPIFDFHGDVIGVLGAGMDITERKKAEEALWLRNVAIESSINGIAFVDIEGNLTYVNESFLKLWGYSDEKQVLGKPAVGFWADPDKAAEIREIVHNRGGWTGELVAKKQTGSIFDVELSASLVKDENTNPVCLMASFLDITERKKAEEELEAGKKKLETYIESMVDGVAVADPQNRLIQANKALAELFGYDSVNEMLGMDTADLVPKREISRIMEAGKECIKKGILRNFETIALRKDGWEVPIQLNATALKDPSGKLVGNMSVIRDITERKRAEQALQESEEKYRSFVQDFQGIAYRGNMNFVPVFFHGAVKEITGYTEEEFAAGSLRWDQIICADDRPKIYELAEKVRAAPGNSANAEYRIVRKDGSIRWVNDYVHTVGDESGQVVYVDGTIHDITERKRMEEALSASEEQYRAIFEQAADAIVLVDAETGELLEFNDRTHENLGYTREEFRKLKIPDLEVIESAEEVAKHIEKIITEGADTFETKHRTKGGEIRDVQVSSRAISIREKDFIQSIWCDITERKQAEQKLRESEERLKILFEYAPDGIYLNDLKGNFVDGNKAAEELVGFKREELIGKNLAEVGLLPAGETPKALANLEKVANGEPTGPDEFTLERKDGNSISVEIRTFPVRIKDQILSLGIARDITERKNVEQRLLQEQAKLKSLASELTLAEERERRRIATELHDRIGQSLVISKMNLEALRKSEYGKKTDETLGEICNLLAQTIADTRTLTFDLSSPILYQLGFETAVAEWLTEQIQDEHGIATQFEDDGQPKPLGDDIGVLLFRNVRELLINVVRHARAKKTKVSIRRVGKKIQVSVEDDGVGFDPAKAASMAAKRAEFGLFSIRQRLEELGGHLEIKSEPGRGCKVTMTAPLKQE